MPPAFFEIPGFSAEQVRSVTKLIEHALDTALEKTSSPLPPLEQQSSVLQPAHQEQEHKPSGQAIAENTAESISGVAGSSKSDNTSLLPTIPPHSAMQICREITLYPSNVFLASFFGFFLASFLAPLLASQLGYIRCAEGKEATGQG